jgi:hypothetical protein
MRLRPLVALLLPVVLAAASCQQAAAPEGPAASALVATTPVRVSELHYDNTGTDVGEAIEISGPAGMDVTGWQVVLYNGTGGASYNTQTLSGSIPATCGTRGVIVLNYPTNGIQNGGAGATATTDPDGIAIVDATGTVVEFISYEGVFTAADGPAAGLASTDIGVRELGTEPAGLSLSRNAAGVWSGPAANTFGTCNDNDEPPPPPEVATVTVAPATATVTVGSLQAFTATAFDASSQPISGIAFTWSTSAPAVAAVDSTGRATGVAAGDATITATAPNGVSGNASLHVNEPPPPGGLPSVRFTELHYDNAGTDVGESIEIEGPAGTDLTGYSIVLYNGNGGVAYNTRALSGTIPATCDARGVVVETYPQDGIQNGSPDGLALVDAAGQVIEFLSYEGTFTAADGPAAGTTSTDIGAAESSAPAGQSLQRDSFDHWALATSTFGACNDAGTPPPPPQPPLGKVDGPYASLEGDTVTMSAAGSIDTDGTVVSYSWSFGDGSSASGPLVTHAYLQDGVYTISLLVTDTDGLTDLVTTTATVTNVAPVVGGFPGATLLPRDTYTAAGTFTDPGADSWTATVDWGDGSALTVAALADRSFSLSHVYLAQGVFTVTVSIADGLATASRTQTVTVFSPAQGIQDAIGMIDQLLAARRISPLVGAVLKIELTQAKLELNRGRPAAAAEILRLVVGEIDLLVRVRAFPAADAAPLRALLVRVIGSL